MEDQSYMEVNLDEERAKKRSLLPWDPIKPSDPPTYKEPVKITVFMSRGGGALMKEVDESPDPEAFTRRIRRQNISKKKCKELQKFTGIHGRKKHPSPVRVYDEEDGPPKLTERELRRRKKRDEMDPGEAMKKSLEGWQKKVVPALHTLVHPKEWRMSPAILRLRQALGLPQFPPDVVAQAREMALIAAAKQATRDAPVCHPLCLFGLSPSARALFDAEAELAAQMGVLRNELCREREDRRCETRQLLQATVAEESARMESERRHRRGGKERGRKKDRDANKGRGDSDEDSDESREGKKGKRKKTRGGSDEDSDESREGKKGKRKKTRGGSEEDSDESREGKKRKRKKERGDSNESREGKKRKGKKRRGDSDEESDESREGKKRDSRHRKRGSRHRRGSDDERDGSPERKKRDSHHRKRDSRHRRGSYKECDEPRGRRSKKRRSSGGGRRCSDKSGRYPRVLGGGSSSGESSSSSSTCSDTCVGGRRQRQRQRERVPPPKMCAKPCPRTKPPGQQD